MSADPRRTLLRIRFDPSYEDQWFLGAPKDATGNELDPRIFTEGRRVHIEEELFIPQKEQGLRRELGQVGIVGQRRVRR